LAANGGRSLRRFSKNCSVSDGFPLSIAAIFGHENFILPPLLFEAAINIHWRDLRRDLGAILTLAILGTVIAAAIITFGLRFGLGWPLKSAALFGILIAATDPVAVIAMFKDNGITGRLRLITESESLFNDGVAAVLFTLALLWAQLPPGGAISSADAAGSFLLIVGGGIFAGALCAGAALAVAGHTTDHLVESTLTAVTAYGAFQLAQHFGGSGVLATITAGLLVGNFGVLADDRSSRLTTEGREFALALWEFIAFIANSLIFLRPSSRWCCLHGLCRCTPFACCSGNPPSRSPRRNNMCFGGAACAAPSAWRLPCPCRTPCRCTTRFSSPPSASSPSPSSHKGSPCRHC
jgi:NhaP-type Na+/H+ or K+/H+ antiporter